MNPSYVAANTAFRKANPSQQRMLPGREQQGTLAAQSPSQGRFESPGIQSSWNSSDPVPHSRMGNDHELSAVRTAALVGQSRFVADDRRPNSTDAQQKPHPPLVPPRVATPNMMEQTQATMNTKHEDDDNMTESIPDEDALNPADPFIVIMGVTGAGKSTFISLLSEDPVEIGHDLQSSEFSLPCEYFKAAHVHRPNELAETKHVDAHRFQCPDGRKGWLVDTPGFDDTGRPTVEILKEIIATLTKLYERGGRVSGLIYLHRITDPRMSGSALKTLQIFTLLVGGLAMPMVRLVTTRWNEVDLMGPDLEKAQRLEDQLRGSDKFWAPLIHNGAIAMRHHGDTRSAKAVVASLLERKDPPPKLAIVREIMDENRSLLDTAAGRYIDQDNDELRKHYEKEIAKLQQERKQAQEDKDHEVAEILAAEEMEYERQRQAVISAKSQLNVNLQRLHDQVYQQILSDEVRNDDAGEPQALRSENELLHLERTELEDKLAKRDLQHRIEVGRLQAALAQQNQKQRMESERAISQTIRRYEQECSDLERELRHLRRKNRKLKQSRGLLNLLM